MRLVRTSFAFESTREFFKESGGNHLIESYLVQYLIVAYYSEFEKVVKSIILSRLSSIGDERVSSFISHTNEGMLKRVKKAELNDVLKKFGCGEGDILSNFLGDLNLQPYFDAISNRHLVAHQDGARMTIDEFGKALECGDAVLDALEALLEND